MQDVVRRAVDLNGGGQPTARTWGRALAAVLLCLSCGGESQPPPPAPVAPAPNIATEWARLVGCLEAEVSAGEAVEASVAAFAETAGETAEAFPDSPGLPALMSAAVEWVGKSRVFAEASLASAEQARALAEALLDAGLIDERMLPCPEAGK